MNAEKTETLRILIVQSKPEDESALVELLGNTASIQFASSIDEAADLVAAGQFHFVISGCSTFADLDKTLVTQQASTVLEAIDQGVCVINRERRVVWSNHQFGDLNDEVRGKVADGCLELLDSCDQSDGGAQTLARHFNLLITGELYYEVTATPIIAADGEVHQIAAVVTDVTAGRRLQRKINTIDRAGRELVRLDAQELSKLDFSERLTLLEERIVRFTKDLMHFSNLAIWLLNKSNNQLRLLINYDFPPDAVEIELQASTEGYGICGYVAASGRSYICPDVDKDPRYLPGIVEARSSLTVPLLLNDEVMGVLNVENINPNAFEEDDRQFAEIFGRYIAIALNTFDLLVTERVTTTGKLANDVQTEITAPLNDIITDATTLMEDYIGHDDLRQRLQHICDNVLKVKQTVKSVTEPGTGLFGGRKDSPNRDPVLAGKRVLIADDEEAIRETIGEILTSYCCEVETARDGAEAVCMIGGRQYDLVLSDIRMPNKNGYDVFAATKEADPACPVILMTGFGYDPNHSIIRARREGLSAVLFKPFKVDQLLGELRSALQSSAST